MSFLLLNQKSPGVYVNEVRSGSAPIVGVGTSTAAILLDLTDLAALALAADQTPDVPDAVDLGYADLGGLAADTPALVTTLSEFRERLTGTYRARLVAAFNAIDKAKRTDDNASVQAIRAAVKAYDAAIAAPAAARALAAVSGFFANGGTRCHVVVRRDLDASLAALDLLDDVAIVAAPGLVDGDRVAQHCARRGDRFAILDGTTDKPALAASKFAAYYYPHVEVDDPTKDKGATLVVGPAAHIAGAYARVDATRGVHKAPANVDLFGVRDVAVAVSRAEQDGMNARGVNALRRLQGGVRLYGARTWGGDANGEFKFINVQRTLVYLARSLDQGLQWVVFEPNTPALWAKVARNVNAFLHQVWATGALFGSTPEAAWYVRCDEAQNPPDERAQGKLQVEVGVALTRPAEFVVVNLTQWSGPAA